MPHDNEVYPLEDTDEVCCYFCLRAGDATLYRKGEAFLAGPGHSPCDANANHLDPDAVIWPPEESAPPP